MVEGVKKQSSEKRNVDQSVKSSVYSNINLVTVLYFFVYVLAYFGCSFLPSFIRVGSVFNYSIGFDNNVPNVHFFLILYIFIYYLAYFLPVGVFVMSKDILVRFFVASIIGFCISFITFLFKPSCIFGTSIQSKFYFIEAFTGRSVQCISVPSLVCFLYWLGYLSVRKNIVFDKLKNGCFILFFVCICVSVLFSKCSPLLGVVTGILLAEFSWKASGYQCVSKFFKY